MKVYYEFRIWLLSPYKWGDGYGKATQEEIESNEKALKEIIKMLGWSIKEKEHSWDCNVVYNKEDDMEEIYMHPMELSGVATKETIEKIESFIKEKDFPYTKVSETKMFDKIKKWDIETLLKLLMSKVEEVRRRHPYGVAMNYNFEDVIGEYKVKNTRFAHTSTNRELDDLMYTMQNVINKR